jgi:hypothetical protein
MDQDLNIRPEILKLLQETLNGKGTGNAFLNRTPIAQEIRARN